MDTLDRITSGRILIYHLFELAEEVDLSRLRQDWADSTVGQLVPRRNLPGAIQFRDPPVVLPMGARPLTSTLSGTVKAKIFDFGVASISWEIAAPGTWERLIACNAELMADVDLEASSRRVLDEIRGRLAPACKGLIPDSKLVEDYFIVYVEAFDTPALAQDILSRKGDDLALLLRGELADLSIDEKRDALRLHHSYRSNDLVIVTWSAAFVFDPDRSTEHIDILEFANAQLLDLRYYDSLLDRELEEIYDGLQARGPGLLGRGKIVVTSQRLNRLMIEVYDLREKIRNSLKMLGEMYSARIYRLIADSLRLSKWDDAVDEKLRIAQQVYTVVLEELNHARFLVLELIIILLIAVEVAFFFVPKSV